MSELRRRVPVQKLRGVDPLMLEVLVNDLVEKPMGQVAPENVADLFALMDVPTAPAGFRRRAANYRQRIGVEIGDVPNGSEFANLAADWRDIDGARVPDSLRAVWREVAADPKRTGRERALVEGLLEGWDAAEAVPFSILPPPPPRAAAAPSSTPRAERGPRVERLAERPPRAAKAPTAPRAAAAPRAPKPVDPDEAERRQWIRMVCIERLAGVGDRGLLQTVLAAGVVHRAREQYPGLLAAEVVSVLHEMAKRNEARVSAGRWTIVLGRR